MQELPPGFVIDNQPQQPSRVITKRVNEVEQRGDILKNQLTEAQIAKMLADLQEGDKPKLPVGYRMGPNGVAELIPGVAAPGTGSKATAAQRTEAIQGFNDANALRRIAADLRRRYEQGAGATSGVAGLQDFLPTAQNTGFDKVAQRARGYVKRSLGFTGGEGNTVAESTALYDPYLPNTSDWDSTILDKIGELEALAGDAERKSIAVLGGRPDANGNITPVGTEMPATEAPQQMPPQGRDTTPALLGGGNGGGPGFGNPAPDPSGFVPYGSQTRRENNPQWKGVNEAVKGMIVAGQSPDQISAYLQERGISTDALTGVGQAIDYYRRTGKKDFRVNVDDIEVPMSSFEQFRNNAPQTRVGTAAATALNAGGFGVPQSLAGDQLQYLRDQNPGSAWAGDVAGIIGATSALGKVGSGVAGRVAPQLLTGGGKVGNAARAIAPDAAYGAIYGGVTEGDPLTGAATATLGSAGGQLIGRGLQKTFTGVTDPAVQYLTQRGIPLSLGETLGNNSIIGRQMQRMESIPVLGDLMSARRGEARDAVYRATLEDAVAPSGQQITGQGVDALASAQGIKNQAYTDAYSGINAPIDAQYVSEVAPFIRTGRNIYGDTGGEFGAVVKDDLRPLFGPNRALDGESAQQFSQTVSDFASDFGARGAYGNKAATQLRGIGEATEGLVERTNPGAVPMIRNANQINANLTPIENAMITAKGVPTPKQLQAAYVNNNKKFGGRAAAARGDKVPDVVRMAVNNAPNIGNSGTADRLAGIMPFLLPTALGGSAVGLETFTDSPFLTGSLATLAALSTRTGQKATQAALTKRPKALRRVGGLFGRRETQKGLAGMVTAPLLIED